MGFDLALAQPNSSGSPKFNSSLRSFEAADAAPKMTAQLAEIGLPTRRCANTLDSLAPRYFGVATRSREPPPQ